MRFLIFLVITFQAFNSYSQIGRVEPFDESAQDQSLVVFIKDLKNALKDRDKQFIKTSIASESYIPFEGGETTTPSEFYNFYFEQQGTGYDLWESLEYVFKIGGGGFRTSENGKIEYFMPYTSANLHDDDPFTSLGSYVIALSHSTPVFDKPSTSASVIKTLSYDIVQVDSEKYIQDWEAIILHPGDTAYVKSADVIYTIAVRCGFVKENDQWKLKFAGGFE